MKIKVLYVCLGNICRSPAGEAIMQKMIDEQNLNKSIKVDSAGILANHKGQTADQRMRYQASRRGYNITHRSRPVRKQDGKIFDIILAMDISNKRDLQRILAEEHHHKIFMMNDFSELHKGTSVPDPYYGDASDFELVLDMLENANMGLLNDIRLSNKL